jgi:SAM-dependent methyltransferase
MAVHLDRVVPFGRSLAEYQLMFNLTADILQHKILDLAAGPASFNAEMRQQGKHVTSVDPIYELSAAVIQQRFNQCVDEIIEQVKMSAGDWVWQYHKSADDLRRNREQALQLFLADYEQGQAEQRYIVGELPELPLEQSFDLALCSHFLFLYSDQLSYSFHHASVLKMLSLAKEVRIFPLLTLDLKRSPHLDPLRRDLEQAGYHSEIITVDYELQRGGNQMLRLG